MRWTGPAGTALLLLPAALLLFGSFLLPMLKLFSLSLSAPSGPLGAYAALLGEPVYRQVFLNTAMDAALVTAIGLVLGYLVALALTLLPPGLRALLFFAVLMPLWISVLVRSFAWMMLLERNGPINRALMPTGLISAPLPLLFNNFAVVLGMVHLLIPYAVLPIYAALIRIDPALLRASEGLGAGTLAHVSPGACCRSRRRASRRRRRSCCCSRSASSSPLPCWAAPAAPRWRC